jgi:subtilase family serine protease
MRARVQVTTGLAAGSLAVAMAAGGLSTAAIATAGAVPMPVTIQAPVGPVSVTSAEIARSVQGQWSGCTAVGGALHCYTPGDIRSAYGVDQLDEKGDGQTIVLVDAYGSPMAAQELQAFHDTFFADEPAPDFQQVFPQGNPQFSNTQSAGLSGPSAAAGWAGEAALDVQYAYAMAPHAHIVLLAVPPAETLGVQGFPNLLNAVSWAIDR